MSINIPRTCVLLKMDGIDNSQIFTDSSPYVNAVTNVGACKISTSAYKYGTGSAAFTNNGDYLSISPVIVSGVSDFTFEGWFSITTANSNYQSIIDFGYGRPAVRFGDGGLGNKFQVAIASNDFGKIYSCALTQASLSGTGFHHFAFVRKSGYIYLYIDGGRQAISPGINPSNYTLDPILDSGSFDISSGYPIKIGQGFIGYIDDLHVLINEAKYTGNFTPPNGPVEAVLPVNVNPIKRSGYRAAGIKLNRSPAVFKSFKYFGHLKGSGSITGSVKKGDIPLSRRVLLYREKDGELMGSVWSDPSNGKYKFINLQLGISYTVVCHDNTGEQSAVISDGLYAEQM